MRHFLTELIANPNLEDPSTKMSMHRHFARYSKGKFSGPTCKITVSPSKIAVASTFEYEDVLTSLAAKFFPEPVVNIAGTIVSADDINNELEKIGVKIHVEESTGQAKNFKAKVEEDISKDKLVKMIDLVTEHGYILLTFKQADKGGISVTTKKNPPRPNPKSGEEEAADAAVQFCKTSFPNKKEILDAITAELLADFKQDVPQKFKKILIENKYDFSELIIPKNLPSQLIRLKTIRVGRLTRRVEVDEENFEKQYSIRA